VKRCARLTAVIGIAVVLMRCILFTSGTGGYTLQDGGQCLSAAGCAAGLVCCLVPGNGSGGTACQVPPCGIQLCSASPECGDLSCTSQTCGDAALSACGNVPGCAPGQSDAGATISEEASTDGG
jgi:hypothetical protein